MLKGITNQESGQIQGLTRMTLDEMAREGARRMIQAALEVAAYVESLNHLRDEKGHALVIRNGKTQPRTVSAVELEAPRVHDRLPEHCFTSRILPPYMRQSPKLDEAIPVLYLKGLSSSNFEVGCDRLLGLNGALGFGAVPREVYPETQEQRCWIHKIAKSSTSCPNGFSRAPIIPKAGNGNALFTPESAKGL